MAGMTEEQLSMAEIIVLDKPKRIRRKAMNAPTFARFQNACALALQKAIVEFDPTPMEMQLVLQSLHTQLDALMHMTKRRNS